MSIKLTPLSSPTPFGGSDFTAKILRIYFTVVASGNYPALGDLMDFTQLGDLIKSGQPPVFVAIQSAKSGGVSGYFYEYTPAAVPTVSNGFFQVLQCAAAGNPAADLGAGAYPAGITGDNIVGYADFLRL